MSSPINLVYATDARGVLGLTASAWSALSRSPIGRPVHIWVMEEQLSWRQRVLLVQTLRQSDREASVFFVPLDASRFRDLLRSKAVPHVCYARLVMAELLPSWVERCVYLDIDTICMRSVEGLHDIELSGRLVGAVRDSASEEDGRRHFARLGIAASRYFNSGVMVCDVAGWREAGLGTRALDFARSAGSRLILHDQDALNGVLVGDWLDLPDHWNRWPSSGGALDDCIVHYTMTPKPWDPDYSGRGGDLFWKTVDQTAFRGTRPWNPLGLGRLTRKLRRRVPHPPTVLRMISERIVGAPPPG